MKDLTTPAGYIAYINTLLLGVCVCVCVCVCVIMDFSNPITDKLGVNSVIIISCKKKKKTIPMPPVILFLRSSDASVGQLTYQ